MTSWRDGTPSAVQEDFDALVGVAAEMAEQLLTKNGEFYPFGVGQDENGTGIVAGYEEALGEHPESTQVLLLALDALRASADATRGSAAIRAAAVVAPVLAEGRDAVRVEVEHRDGGPALQILFPYSLGRWRRRVSLQESSVSLGARQIWR